MNIRLSIITINYNNTIGLKKTIDSVLNQTSKEFEYIIIDGGSTDNSLQVISEMCLENHDSLESNRSVSHNDIQVKWISEPDSGIYNAMNKGIRLAKGEYLQFLNSGDYLVSTDITEQMLKAMPNDCSIFYGNMLKQMPNGKIFRDTCEQGNITMLTFFKGSLNHSPAYIKHSLFDKYGLYDETLKIVSDWKWYLNVIAIHNEPVKYINMDVTIFDMTGISTVNPCLDKAERKQILSEVLPANVLVDYEHWASTIEHIKRINQYGLTRKVFWLVERILFKIDKWRIKYYR